MDGEPATTLRELAPPAAVRRHSPMLAAVILVVVCILWGYSFPVMQIGTAAFDRHMLGNRAEGSATASILAARAAFSGPRYGLAALVYALFTFRRQVGFTRREVMGGMIVGAFFAGGMLFQTTGLRWTLPSVSSFLTAMAVVFAPLSQAILLRRRVGRPTWFAVGLALVGMALLSWPKPDAHTPDTLVTRPPVPLLGETMTLLAAVLFTGQILSVDHYGQKSDATRLTLVVLATTSFLSLLAAGALDARTACRPVAWAGILSDRTIWWSVGTLTLFSSVAAIHLMNTWQPLVSPATASVIYCTEPVFGTLFSVLFATERLTPLTLLGGSAVLGSVVIVSRFATSPARGE
jgi:drug/metabolite transporter (DMT)-like permease